MYKTSDRGTTWIVIAPEILGGVTSIIADPLNNNILYVTSGIHTNGFGNQHFATGIWKSTDRGNTFFLANTGISDNKELYIIKIAINPLNSNILYAVGEHEIYKSTDKGTSWTSVYSNLQSVFYDIDIDPLTPDTVYVSGTDLLMSLNDGVSWQFVSLPHYQDYFEREVRVEINNNHQFYLYFVEFDDDNDNSRENGYLLKTTIGNSNPVWSAPIASSIYSANYCMDMNYINDNCIFFSTIQLIKWNGSQIISYNTNIHDDVRQVISRQTGNNAITYCVHDGGISKKIEPNGSWQPINGDLAVSEFFDVAITEYNPELFIGGVMDNHTFLHTKYQWSNQIGGDGGTSLINIKNDTINLFGTATFGSSMLILCKRYYPAPTSFNSVHTNSYPNEPKFARMAFYNLPMVQHPTNPNLIYYGHWWVGKILNGISYGSCVWDTSYHGVVTAIGISKSNPNVVYYSRGAVGKKATVLKTTTGFNPSWSITEITPLDIINNNSISVTEIVVKEDDPNTAWICVSGYLLGKKVYKTIDGGTNWANISCNLSNLPILCLVYNKLSDQLLCGSDDGIYIFNYQNNTWSKFGSAMPKTIISKLRINYSTGQLFVATYGRGIWKADLPCYSTSNAIVVTTNTIWDYENHLCGDLLST